LEYLAENKRRREQEPTNKDTKREGKSGLLR
jgi:hypothetical protein